ncbi:MAG: PepSY domain-containing protein [Oscillospiraceae bacterium]|nr:PepSY domain-containing protein [Oscillospiraceae bacterium]
MNTPKKIRKAFKNATPDVLDAVLSDCRPEKGTGIPMKDKKKSKRLLEFAATAAAVVLLFGVGAGIAGLIGSGLTFSPAGQGNQDIDDVPQFVATKPNETEPQNTIGPITSDEAIRIAVEFIGKQPENIILSSMPVAVSCECDEEDGRMVYEIDVHHGSWKYEVEIDAWTGEILDWEREDKISGEPVEYDGADDAIAAARQYVMKENPSAGGEPYLYSCLAGTDTSGNVSFWKIKLAYNRKTYTMYVSQEDLAVSDVEVIDGYRDGDGNAASLISKTKARDIALGDLGIALEDVNYLDIEHDDDSGYGIYKIDIAGAFGAYVYSIDSVTGSILNRIGESGMELNHDYFDYDSYLTCAVSWRDARDKARESADVPLSELTELEFTTLPTNGTAYVIEFSDGACEYECRIHSGTGEILGFSKEGSGTDTEPTPPDGNIGLGNAIRFALEYAGLTADQVRNLECGFDDEEYGSQLHYDVSFEYGGYEYEIEVHAFCPDILEAEKKPIE